MEKHNTLENKRESHMKKLTALLLGAAMVLSLAACGGTASSSEAASSSEGASSEAASSGATSEAAATEVTTVEPGKLIMTTNAAFPPYEMTTDDGDYEGIDVEIAGAIADKLGLELVIDNKDFDAALLAVQGGEAADMVMAGVTVTDERKAVMDFTDSYASGVQVVIVPEDSDIASIDDMQGKMIGVQRGTTGDLYCSDTVENGGFGEENVTPYPDGLTAVQALNNGQVDCVVIDNAPAQEFVAANPGLKILDTEYANEDYAIGVAKGNTQLLDALNTAIAELKADGTIQAILDKYITAE